jgi:hypothetical protein
MGCSAGGPGRRGRLSAISVFLCKSVLYGAFVWARKVLKHQKHWFPARAALWTAQNAVCLSYPSRAVRSFPPSSHPAAALFHRAPHTTAIRFSSAVGVLRLRQGPRGRPAGSTLASSGRSSTSAAWSAGLFSVTTRTLYSETQCGVWVSNWKHVKRIKLSGPARVRSHCRLRNRGTNSLRKSGMEWMSGGAKRRCGRTLGRRPDLVRHQLPLCGVGGEPLVGANIHRCLNWSTVTRAHVPWRVGVPSV